MSDNIKLLSEIEKYEIINIDDGERHNSLSSNDILIDEEGNLKFLCISNNSSKFSFLSKGTSFVEIPWEYVKKIGVKTVILDVDMETFTKRK